jgi:hypothetical protein
VLDSVPSLLKSTLEAAKGLSGLRFALPGRFNGASMSGDACMRF